MSKFDEATGFATALSKFDISTVTADPISTPFVDPIIDTPEIGNPSSPIKDPEAIPIGTLIKQSNRYNASANFLTSVNHRYKGAREASKFNMIIQKTIVVLTNMFLSLRSKNYLLESKEQLILPTDAEISSYYHCELQIRFKEWLLMKDEQKRWFN